jgi:hypothetical protein
MTTPNGGALMTAPGGAQSNAGATNGQAGGSAGGSGGWLPPFKLGQGQPGVFADARGLIAGEPATITANSLAQSGSSLGSQAIAVLGDQGGGNVNPGANTGGIPGLGGFSQSAGTMPTAGAGTPGVGATAQYPYGAAAKTPPPASAFNSQGEYIGDGLGNS